MLAQPSRQRAWPKTQPHFQLKPPHRMATQHVAPLRRVAQYHVASLVLLCLLHFRLRHHLPLRATEWAQLEATPPHRRRARNAHRVTTAAPLHRITILQAYRAGVRPGRWRRRSTPSRWRRGCRSTPSRWRRGCRSAPSRWRRGCRGPRRLRCVRRARLKVYPMRKQAAVPLRAMTGVGARAMGTTESAAVLTRTATSVRTSLVVDPQGPSGRDLGSRLFRVRDQISQSPV